jgi:predicted amidohydrolase
MKLLLMQPQLRAFDTVFSLDAARALLDSMRAHLDASTLVLLPEHFMFTHDAREYSDAIRSLARDFGCTVIGGSYHDRRSDGAVNAGIAVDPSGALIGAYEKLRPYSDERKYVVPGTRLGEFEIDGRRIMMLICADFWFSDLFFQAEHLPDLVLVPALSVTRKSSPVYSRSLWRHLAVTRAYEFGVYVGISDWGHPSQLPNLFTSGVAGFADPTQTDPALFFCPVSDHGATMFELDFDRLEDFRADRRHRGFFWK